MTNSSAPSTIDEIYLPLQRSGMGRQHVQLLFGEVDKKDIIFDQIKGSSEFNESAEYYWLALSFKKIKETFPISLTLLDYFSKISDGLVSTALNPALSHGLSRIKSMLYSYYGYDEDGMIRLLIHTVEGPKRIELEVDLDDNKLYVLP
jgi:hypothetical protein